MTTTTASDTRRFGINTVIFTAQVPTAQKGIATALLERFGGDFTSEIALEAARLLHAQGLRGHQIRRNFGAGGITADLVFEAVANAIGEPCHACGDPAIAVLTVDGDRVAICPEHR
jgi:hypothetical protein